MKQLVVAAVIAGVLALGASLSATFVPAKALRFVSDWPVLTIRLTSAVANNFALGRTAFSRARLHSTKDNILCSVFHGVSFHFPFLMGIVNGYRVYRIYTSNKIISLESLLFAGCA